MGETIDGKLWCDYCGRQILNAPVHEKYWTFHSEICQQRKHSLLKDSEEAHNFKNISRSLYHAFQSRDDN